MIRLYVLSHVEGQTRDLVGVGGRPALEVDCGRLYAVASEQEQAREPTADAALAHAAIVEAVSQRVPALPVQFGALHESIERLRATVAEQEVDLLETLERVGGRVEFFVRAAALTPGIEAAARQSQPRAAAVEAADAPGRAYLQRRLDEERSLDRLQSDVRRRLVAATASLDDEAVAVVDRLGRFGPERCFLVPRADAERFAALAAPLLASESCWVLGGPWPPYTFAEESPS